MTEGSAPTPSSSAGNGNDNTTAAKDKICLYCHQAFTSSSLGRHLDLYIKEKHAKPPDNIHDVDEIRRLRKTITRRQARTSSGRRDGSIISRSKATPIQDQQSPSLQTGVMRRSQLDDGPVKTYMHQANGQPTGPIEDLLPTSRDDPHYLLFPLQPPGSTGSIKEFTARKQEFMEVVDRGRAAELALQEVLESVKAAIMRAHPPSPYDFNFFGCSLPELYLKCLSPPPSLLAETPNSQQLSWSIDPPSAVECEVLRGSVLSQLQEWRNEREATYLEATHMQTNMSGSLDASTFVETLNHEEAMFYEHIADAQQGWSRLSDEDRRKRWHYECARAFAREQKEHKTTARRLEKAERDIRHLQEQIIQMNVQKPTAFQSPPPTLSLTRETISNLPGSSNWDYGGLMHKWRTRISSARSAQSPLPTSPKPSDIFRQHQVNGNGAHARPHRGDQRPQDNEHGPQSDEDEDLEDAPREEDNGEQAQKTDRQGSISKGVLDPHLRGGGPNEDEDAGGRMLRDLGTSYRGAGGDIGVNTVCTPH